MTAKTGDIASDITRIETNNSRVGLNTNQILKIIKRELRKREGIGHVGNNYDQPMSSCTGMLLIPLLY